MTHIAIIGAGGMAGYHIKGFLKAGASIDAICDVEIKKAQAVAQEYGIEKVYSSLEEMLEKETQLNSVSIILPNFLHCSTAIKCLNHGLNVYCEKPPALNAEEMKRMKEASEKNNCLLVFDFNNRVRPESIALKKYFDDGTMGKVNSAEAVWARRSGIPGIGGWFTNKEKSGGGPVIDLLHMIDLALYFMDYPTPSFVMASTFDDFMGNPDFKGPWGIPDNAQGICNVESSCHAFVKFNNGSCLYIHNSWAEMIEREKVEVTIQGTIAGCSLSRTFKVDGIDDTAIDKCALYTVENGTHVNRNLIVLPDPEMGRITNAQYFIETVENKRKAINNPKEALVLMKIIDALYLSTQSGKPIEIKD